MLFWLCAGAAVLLGSTSSAQVQSPGVSTPAGPGAMPGNIRVERLDGSILLIGIRQETDRVELSSVIGLGRLIYMVDHDEALRVAVLYSQGADFVGGILDPESWAPVLRTGKFPEISQFVNPVGTILHAGRSRSSSRFRATARVRATNFFWRRISALQRVTQCSPSQKLREATSLQAVHPSHSFGRRVGAMRCATC